ncbi:hypothetical protein [Segetibacter aerophilus]|nr:hypothetical protein [Segetibacter aerophilus]
MKNITALLLIFLSLQVGAQVVKRLEKLNSPAGQGSPVNGHNPNSFTLASTVRTSAGVYKTDGTLVRTLWSGMTKPAGTYAVKWDGTDDLFNTLPIDEYNVKVLSNHVSYDWQGVIGNTSTFQTGNRVHRSLDPAIGIVVVNNKAYYCVGYGEGESGNGMFALNNIQEKNNPMPFETSGQNSDFMATDGTMIYWAGYDAFQPHHSFVFATKVNDRSEVKFSKGINTPVKYAHTYASAIGYRDDANGKISGLAVSSGYIFICRKTLNEVLVLNKVTGAVAQRLTYTTPSAITISNTTLWLCTGTNTVSKYTIKSDGSLTASGTVIDGFISPITMANNGNIVALVDGGSSQQIKAFDVNSGRALWTLGQVGGHISSPVVANDRFGFWKFDPENASKQGFGAVAFAPDGSFWVCDPANYKIAHFAANRTYIEGILYTGRSYSLAVDVVNHTRVINSMHEYKVDYTSPIKSSWTYKYNWQGNVTSNYDMLYQIRHMATLSNGRTYAMMKRKSDGRAELVELDPATGIRYTGLIFSSTAKIYADGSIGEMQNSGVNERQYFKKRTLIEFVGRDPVYSGATTIATHTNTARNEPRNASINIYPTEITSSGILTLYKGGRTVGETSSYHLGGLDVSTEAVKWKTALPTFDEYQGPFPHNGDFEVGNFGGNDGGQGDAAMAIEKSIFTHYYGEFWKNGQTNIFNHYYENGLFVGQFGTTSDDVTEKAAAGMAGNAFSPVVVKVGQDYYIYHNDESYHGGTHRWKISGLNTVTLQTIPITSNFVRTSETPALPGVDLMAGLPYRSVLPGRVGAITRTPATETRRWQVKTNSFTYQKRNSYDVYFEYSETNKSNSTIDFNLGKNSSLANWSITGEISYAGAGANSPDNNGTNQYLDVLDNAGKIIVRIYRKISYTNFYTTQYANNTAILSQPDEVSRKFTSHLQPIKIAKSGGNIIVTYAGQRAVRVAAFDPTADIRSPAKLQVKCTNDGGGQGKKGSLHQFRFFTN